MWLDSGDMRRYHIDKLIKVLAVALGCYTLLLLHIRRRPLEDVNAVIGRRPSVLSFLSDVPDAEMQTLILSNKEMETLQKLRLYKLRRACKNTLYSTSLYTSWDAYYDRLHNFIYCPIPRNGEETWKSLILYANGKISDPSDSTEYMGLSDVVEVEHMSPSRLQMFLQTSDPTPRANFLFLRDPWMRLLSAYISLAVDKPYTRYIQDPCEWQVNNNLTFRDFLTCIVTQINLGQSRMDLEEHWRPQSMFCNVCADFYTHIGKVETFQADTTYLMKKLGLKDAKIPKKHKSQAAIPLEAAKKYYAGLSPRLIEELKKIYWFDFELFGYKKTPPGF